MSHTPVLLKEVVEALNIKSDFRMIDCTAGSGGHLKEVLRINPKASILAIDWDQTSLTKLHKDLSDSGSDAQVKLVSAN